MYKYVLIIIMKHPLVVLIILCFYFIFHIFRREDFGIMYYYNNPIELKKRVNLDSNLKSDDIKVDTLKIGNMNYLSNITKNENVIKFVSL